MAVSQISREQIVRETLAWVGTPFRHQASARGVGCDCLGLVRGVWRALYGSEAGGAEPYGPDWSERDAGALERGLRHWLVARESAARAPGDVLAFSATRGGPARHVGVLTSGDRFAHAYWGRAVLECRLSDYWRERLTGAYSFPGAA